jgi:hypothetical protein
VRAEEFFRGAPLGVFDFLEVEEADLGTAPEEPVTVILRRGIMLEWFLGVWFPTLRNIPLLMQRDCQSD